MSAEYNGFKGLEAFRQFCRWEGASYLFTPRVEAPDPGPAQNLIKLLMDACEVQGPSAAPQP